MPLCIIFVLHLLYPFAFSLPYGIVYNIDCGGSVNFTDQFNRTWLADRFFSAGSSVVVSEPLRFSAVQEKTLRHFPLSSGKTNCYSVKVPNGRYHILIFTVYDNYDDKNHSPSFEVSVEGTVVFSWRNPWPGDLPRQGAYSDLFVFISDGQVDVCFHRIATDDPIIASLEIIQVEPLSYYSHVFGNNSILVNYGRLNCGSSDLGSGVSNELDFFDRGWHSDGMFRSQNRAKNFRVISVGTKINGTNVPPNYFPMKLFQTAVIGHGVLEYNLSVDAEKNYLLVLHFAEIDRNVHKAGQRVFQVVLNGKTVKTVDIFDLVGQFMAYSWYYTVHNLSSTIINVTLVPLSGSPLICGIEKYALVQNDISTVPNQTIAMRELKESLRVPSRMGWNGDPCAPINWDAWEGVSCQTRKSTSDLVITQIDLGDQGLNGYISPAIGLLSNLLSLNLSSNFLEGNLPSGLGQKSLLRLDLSKNQFSGHIPASLDSSNLQLVLLNDNLLEGQVSEKLCSVGMHGGIIDLSGNKELCGVSPLPQCSVLWKDGHLSTNGKIAIILSCLVIIPLVLMGLYVVIVWRGRNDYDFAPSHDLMSMAAKRNRYQRQKSLMDLEMESQHAKGFLSSHTG